MQSPKKIKWRWWQNLNAPRTDTEVWKKSDWIWEWLSFISALVHCITRHLSPSAKCGQIQGVVRAKSTLIVFCCKCVHATWHACVSLYMWSKESYLQCWFRNSDFVFYKNLISFACICLYMRVIWYCTIWETNRLISFCPVKQWSTVIGCIHKSQHRMVKSLARTQNYLSESSVCRWSNRCLWLPLKAAHILKTCSYFDKINPLLNLIRCRIRICDLNKVSVIANNQCP